MQHYSRTYVMWVFTRRSSKSAILVITLYVNFNELISPGLHQLRPSRLPGSLTVWLVRPPDIVCRRTYILPVFLSSSFFLSFFLSFFFRRLISKVAERNLTKIGHMVGSKCNLKTHVRNLEYPLPLQIGGPKTIFGRLRNLTATLTAYIFGMKEDIDNLSSALTTTRCLLHCPKMSWTLVHKHLQTRPAFLPTLCKFRIPLHCQASQTEISKRNSTTLCQTVDRRPL